MKISKKIRLVLFLITFVSLNTNISKCHSEQLIKLNPSKEIRRGYLLIGIKQYLGNEKKSGKKNRLLSLESKNGLLKITSSNGLEYQSKKVNILFNKVPLQNNVILERLVSNPFASFESAKKASILLEEKGLNPKITYPNDWEIWLPPEAQNKFNSNNFKLKKIDIAEKIIPFLRNEYVFQKLEGITRISSNENIKINDVEYGKKFYLIKDSYGSWTLIQKLSFDDYLRGVLPYEIGSNSPIEALKAQAIIARTWAIYNSDRFKSDNYHLCITTQCQVYKPSFNNNQNIENAILETSNVILTYNGNPINAFYHASNGGISASANESWEMKDYPYLLNKRDLIGLKNHTFDDFYQNEQSLKDFIFDKDHKYFGSKHYLFRWTRKISSHQIFNSLSKLNFLTHKNQIQDVKVIERGKSGRVLKLEIKQSGGLDPVILYKDDIRRHLKFLPSNLFIIDKINDDFWVFTGGGFGHGVGLSQSGAIEMANLGFNYKRILDHYYEGANIEDFKYKKR